MTSPPFSWQHTDPRGLADAIPQAIARAKAREWASDASSFSTGTRAADFRALVLATAAMRAELSNERQRLGEAGQIIIQGDAAPRATADNSRRAAMQALPRTLSVLVDGVDPLRTADFAARIKSDGDGAPRPDAGWLIAVVAIVAGAAAVTAIYIYASQKAAEVVDRKLARDADSQRLVETHARMLELLDGHTKDERTQGKILPFTPAEQTVLGILTQAQTDIIKKSETPIPDPFGGKPGPGAGFVSGLLVAVIVAAYFAFGDD